MKNNFPSFSLSDISFHFGANLPNKKPKNSHIYEQPVTLFVPEKRDRGEVKKQQTNQPARPKDRLLISKQAMNI
jgi:hypothetical protein